MTSHVGRTARLLVLALAALLLSRGLTDRFNGWHEFNSALHTQFARNHIAYGLTETKLYCIRGVTPDPPRPPQRYLNHPPLLALWVAAPLATLGDHEWTARLVPIAATLGSTALLMVILSRLGGPLLGLVGGLAFALLPGTVHFGQMVDHVAPVQLLSLLALHGYLHWSRAYGEGARPRRGALEYAVGVVLGIGTGWAAVLMAGLLLAWHTVRVVRGDGEARLLPWLVAVPGGALLVVVLHIVAGAEGGLSLLGALLASRGGSGGFTAAEWLAAQGVYLMRNFTVPGAVAATLGVPAIVVLLARSRRGLGPLRLRHPAILVAVVVVTGLQGMLYVLVLRRAAWFHDYWQMFLAPFVATSVALLAVGLHGVLQPRSTRLAALGVAAVLTALLPGLRSSLEFYDRVEQVDPRYLEALATLSERVPWRAPVWTGRRPRGGRETLGDHVNRWGNAIEVYYSNRPLLFSRDVEEVSANAPGCAAYLLPIRNKPWSEEVARALSRHRRVVPVGDHHLIVLLDPGAPRGRGDPGG